jgi:glutathione S-transferase
VCLSLALFDSAVRASQRTPQKTQISGLVPTLPLEVTHITTAHPLYDNTNTLLLQTKIMLRARASQQHARPCSARGNHQSSSALLPFLARAASHGGVPPTTTPPQYATVVPRASSNNNSSNPLAGMLSGLFGGGAGASGAAAVATTPATATATTTTTQNPSGVVFSNTAPSWEELRAMVVQREQQIGAPPALADRGGSFLAPDLADGPPHPLAQRRTFGGPESDIEIVLYRDHAAWCPYCEKVVLQLEAKRIPYEVRKINMRCYGPKPADFLAKVPSGLLPVLEIDGRVITESATIMALLEEKYAPYPEKHRPLMPAKGTAERGEADNLLRLERRFFGDWLDWLVGGSGWGGGVDMKQQAAAQRRFEMTVQACEQAMPGPGPFFMGLEQPSLVDITFAPMMERAAASLAYYKGWYLRGQGRFPRIDRWFDAMETEFEAFAAFRSDYFTHAHDLPPQLGGCTMTAEGQAVAAALDGSSAGSSWRLPLPPLSATSMPEPFAGRSDDARDRVEAAARLVANHGAVVRFALRGAGQPGARPVSAPLADPSAVPAMQYERAADAALRHVAHALLAGVEAKQAADAGALRAAVEGGAAAAAGAGAGAAGAVPAAVGDVPAVVASLEYLRDRVGVPRDMRFPAARQLRAHINWFLDTVCAV